MNKIVVLAAALILLTGCQSTAGTAKPQPRKLDCNLIFPAPSSGNRA